MHYSNIPATTLIIILFISACSAQQTFQIFPFHAQDVFESGSSESHSINFNISRPGAVPQQGGDGTHNCVIEWDGSDAPTCYQLCTSVFGLGIDNADYWARVTPDAGKNTAADLSIDVLEYYSYRQSVVQNATFVAKDQETSCYGCEAGSDEGRVMKKSCALKNVDDPVRAKVEEFGVGIYPVSSVVPVCGES